MLFETAREPLEPILLVEDEVQTATAVRKWLVQERFQISWSPSGGRGLRLLAVPPLDAVILDWMAPDLSGLDLLEKPKKDGKKLPFLWLTARDTVEDWIRGLDTGADDYLVKQFALAARARPWCGAVISLGDTPKIWKIDSLD